MSVPYSPSVFSASQHNETHQRYPLPSPHLQRNQELYMSRFFQCQRFMRDRERSFIRSMNFVFLQSMLKRNSMIFTGFHIPHIGIDRITCISLILTRHKQIRIQYILYHTFSSYKMLYHLIYIEKNTPYLTTFYKKIA